MSLAGKVLSLWYKTQSARVGKHYAWNPFDKDVDAAEESAQRREDASRRQGKSELQVARDILRQLQFDAGMTPGEGDMSDEELARALKLKNEAVTNESLKTYIGEVLTELKRDEEFIKSLKKVRVRSEVPDIDKFADEWSASQKSLKPADVAIARRLARDRFPDLYDRSLGDVQKARRALNNTLTDFFRKRSSK